MIENIFQLDTRQKYAAAVSGGSDSLAMLLMLHELDYHKNIVIVHFDHNLRPESAGEARWLKGLCQKLGFECIVGKWQKPKTDENLQKAARVARYDFFKNTCHNHHLKAVLVAHTKDDVVETMLMRLGRGSGLSGLSAMKRESDVLGVEVLRPLLGKSREELQRFLVDKNQDFISDPSNENEKFFRIRVRKLKEHLKEAGLNYEHMAESSKSLRRADDALNFFVDGLASHLIVKKGEQVSLLQDIFLYPKEVQLRLLAKALFITTDEGLAPRTSKRLQALKYMNEGVQKFTLGGAVFTLKGEVYLLAKER